jgi:hypothetical protein
VHGEGKNCDDVYHGVPDSDALQNDPRVPQSHDGRHGGLDAVSDRLRIGNAGGNGDRNSDGEHGGHGARHRLSHGNRDVRGHAGHHGIEDAVADCNGLG